MNAWDREIGRRAPPGFPTLFLHSDSRRFPEGMPEQIERDVLHLEIAEILLDDPEHERAWWGPMRRGEPRPHKLNRILVARQRDQWSVRFCAEENRYSYAPRRIGDV
jgi:hypothetical protein